VDKYVLDPTVFLPYATTVYEVLAESANAVAEVFVVEDNGKPLTLAKVLVL
jgi:hypothetical protein